MNKKTIEDVKVNGKRVFVRCDFNVPIDDAGRITDENRIVEALPTIKYLLKNNAKVILCSHLGRPKGTFNNKYSLKPVALRLSELLGLQVKLASDVIGEDACAKVAGLKEGEIVLLENVRFHAEEEKNDKDFSKALSKFAEIYVNDAFGTAHRAHASTAGIADFCKENVAGYLIEKEVKLLGDALINPNRPFVAVLGGAKVSDKIGVIENLINKADSILIGGAMAYTFLAAKGIETGISRVETDKIELAGKLLQLAEKNNVELLLPIDHVATREFSADAKAETFLGKIPEGYMGLDIGSETCKLYAGIISRAATVLWNGPMGVFEFPKFAVGTNYIATTIADNKKATTIIGGGDSAAAIEQMGLKDKMTHVSTGGGASLEFIEGKVLPGIDCLDNK